MKRWINFFALLVAYFFLFSANPIKAIDILEYPVASEISYGEPLWCSKLNGGLASVEGKFIWKDENLILHSGVQSATVVFDVEDEAHLDLEFNVDVNVKQRRVYIKFEQDLYKLFDEKRDIKLPNYVVRGIIDSEVYVKGDLVGVLEDALVGENKKVELSGLTIMNDYNNNYFIDYDGFFATVYPKYIEKFGNEKNKVDFYGEIYVPTNSVLYIGNGSFDDLEIEGYIVKDTYDIHIKNEDESIDIDGRVKVRIKVDEDLIKQRRVSLFNYYKDVYKEVDYVYEDGYVTYMCEGLGTLVIVEKQINYWLIFVLVGAFLLVGLSVIVVNCVKNKEHINKYKSEKRSKDYGNY